MVRERRVDELRALKEIAETLNSSHDMRHMLDAVLGKLLEVTGLRTGWIFLMDEEPEYSCVADRHLPPALAWGDKTPMCRDSCWCVDKYWNKRLMNAVNIINCKRIEDALAFDWGDTEGIHHHATVPLKAGDEWFGLLNVASPGKQYFTDEELNLLESVAFQIGTAIKRTKLYHAEQKRAESYAKLGEISKQLAKMTELHKITGEVVKEIGSVFPWSAVSFFVQKGDGLFFRSLYTDGKLTKDWRKIAVEEAGPVGRAVRQEKTGRLAGVTETYPGLHALGIPPFGSAVAVPVRYHGHLHGLLFVTSPRQNGFDDDDVDVLHALADHISLAMENVRLNQQRSELSKQEERNRLARDLHDSVNQHLFSLSLMARGLETVLAGTNETAEQILREIQQLTEEALKEMRGLIWQLRPAGLEQGLLTALKEYGAKLGLTVREKADGVKEIPRPIEETLWRIGQESLNNVSKHAGVSEVRISLRLAGLEVRMEIADEGRGFAVNEEGRLGSLGLTSMRERAELLGGMLTIDSKPGQGTRVTVAVPLH
jgi:signal transduction histidine kinase